MFIAKFPLTLRTMLEIVLRILFLAYIATAKITAVAPDLKTALQRLNAQTPFVDFDLDLTEDEKHQFAKLAVKSGIYCDNYGNLSRLLVDLTVFFESLGNDYNSSYTAAKAIYRVVRNVIKDFGTESFWLSMRLPGKSDAFDVPRWHTDGYYYQPFEGNVPKVFFVLKGPTTLFYNISSKNREKFNEIFYRKVEDKDEVGSPFYYYGGTMAGRKELNKLVDYSKVHQPPLYTGTVLLAGGEDATIHSEPPIHEDRIFISILPGSKKQIQEWHDKCCK